MTNFIMYRYFIVLISFLMILPAHASRLALVIGNADYQHVTPLANPVNDASDIAESLINLGFEVINESNINQRTMITAIQQFGARLRDNDVGLFYYSGHGIQSGGRNYLIPVDAQIASQANIEFESVDANRVLEQMEQANNELNIVILDACRDNPNDISPVDNSQVGLAEMKSPTGTLIAYATVPNTASYGDSSERNSIYTKYLLAALRDKQKISMSVLDMLTIVTQKVVTETNGIQVPWKSDSLTQRFCFGSCTKLWQSVSQLLGVCEKHLTANRLSIGRGGTALACYEEVLKKDPTNAEALVGLEKISAKYQQWIETALAKKQVNQAKQYLASLRKINPESPKLAELEARLNPPSPPFEKDSSIPQRENEDSSLSQSEGMGDFFEEIFHDRLKDGGLGPEMVRIPAGHFQMGDIQGGGDDNEKPVHWVSVTKLAIGRYEVTFAEYDRFAEATNKPDDKGWGRGQHPVINVSWHDAVAYTQWLTQQTGKQYRLPTEAEWEYAARAGTTTQYWWGNKIGQNRAACDGCGAQWGWDANRMTAPVGSFAPNPFGLYDTVGNVWEWVADPWHDNYIKAPTEARLWEEQGGNKRLLRGGSWLNLPSDCRVSDRVGASPNNRDGFVGFRVVLVDWK